MDHDPRALTGEPLRDRTKRLLLRQHRIDLLQHRSCRRNSPRIRAMFFRDSVVQRAELRRTVDRVHRELHQNPPEPRRTLLRQPPQAGLSTRRMHGRHESGMRAEPATVGKSLNVPDLTHNEQRRVGADARHRLQQLSLRVGRSLALNGGGDLTNLGGQVGQGAQIALEPKSVARSHRNCGQKSLALDACYCNRRYVTATWLPAVSLWGGGQARSS